MKKNATVLRRLDEWLKDRPAITPPVLIIDDEADQAPGDTWGEATGAHRCMRSVQGGVRMGLLDGKKALIFGVANDHSIAWGIAKALCEQGGTPGILSAESLIGRRVRPHREPTAAS